MGRRTNQPTAIFDIFTGILLGPSMIGNYKSYFKHIFPNDSIIYITLVGNIGLVLFLFLTGVDLDIPTLTQLWKVIFSICISCFFTLHRKQ